MLPQIKLREWARPATDDRARITAVVVIDLLFLDRDRRDVVEGRATRIREAEVRQEIRDGVTVVHDPRFDCFQGPNRIVRLLGRIVDTDERVKTRCRDRRVRFPQPERPPRRLPILRPPFSVLRKAEDLLPSDLVLGLLKGILHLLRHRNDERGLHQALRYLWRYVVEARLLAILCQQNEPGPRGGRPHIRPRLGFADPPACQRAFSRA